MGNTSTFQPSNYASQSIALHQLVLHAAKITSPGFVPHLLRVVCLLELISAVLYVVSAIPTIRKEGFWLFKPEANGMIRPNTRILIPICVVLYVAFDVTTLTYLLRDLKSGTIVSVAAGGIGLCTYPLLLCTGWTKIWNVLRAVPPTKYGLTAAVQANGELNLSYFRPRTINCLSAFFYGFPILFGGAPIYLITKEIWLLGKTFNEYNRNYLSIINGDVQGASVLLLNLEALKQLNSMVQHSEKVLFLAKLLSSGYLLYVVISFLFMMFGYLRILQALDTRSKPSENHLNTGSRLPLQIIRAWSWTRHPKRHPFPSFLTTIHPPAIPECRKHEVGSALEPSGFPTGFLPSVKLLISSKSVNHQPLFILMHLASSNGNVRTEN